MSLSKRAYLHWKPTIESVAGESGIDPLLVAAIMSRESDFGLALSVTHPNTGQTVKARRLDLDDDESWSIMAGGTGDRGHGRGLMQIDDRWHDFARNGPWDDPEANIRYAIDRVLAPALQQLQHSAQTDEMKVRMALAAYNAGLARVLGAIRAGADPDSVTTGGDYSQDVLRRRDAIAAWEME